MTDRRGQVLEHSTGLYSFLVLHSFAHWDRSWHRVLILDSKLECFKIGEAVVRHESSLHESWDVMYRRLA